LFAVGAIGLTGATGYQGWPGIFNFSVCCLVDCCLQLVSTVCLPVKTIP